MPSAAEMRELRKQIFKPKNIKDFSSIYKAYLEDRKTRFDYISGNIGRLRLNVHAHPCDNYKLTIDS
jgi:hypothetical protein